MVGADPHRVTTAARNIASDRGGIEGLFNEARPIIARAGADIVGIGRDFATQAAQASAGLLNPFTAIGAVASIAGAAGAALALVEKRLLQLEKELQPLVARAHKLAGEIRARPHDKVAKFTPTAKTTPSPAPQPASNAPGNTTGKAAVEAAKTQLGKPYVWGGNSPSGFDCSGLTSWAYRQAGMEIPRIAASQATGTQVRYEDLQPGDLVVWTGHVAMYAGDGMMIEAGSPVQMSPVRTTNMGMGFKGFWRPTG
ncbi:C40 family peptidase [Corynebacterium aquatimens]